MCKECFDEVVGPYLQGEYKAIPLMFKRLTERMPKASCQLYSSKMRGIFELAVNSDNYKLLASKARERKTIELAWKANLAELKERKVAPGVEEEIERIIKQWKQWE